MEAAMNRALTSIARLHDKEPKLNALVARLKEAQAKTQERFVETNRHFEATDRLLRTRFEETERILRESGERLDARIDELVRAIREFIRIKEKS
jgi:hypothetical protein